MVETDLDKLTQDYLASCQRNWKSQRVGEVEIPINDIYVMLQAIENPPPSFKAERSELAEISSRMENAGFTGSVPKNEKRPDPIELVEAIGRSRHLVLLGEPGSGKSTALRFIGLKITDGNSSKLLNLRENLIPIILDLKTAKLENKIEQALTDEIGKVLQIEENLASTLINHWRDTRNLLILLDGLDEVQDSFNVRSQIQYLVNSPFGQSSHIIVTSRIAGFASLGSGLKEYTIKPFEDSEEIFPYLQNWLSALYPDWNSQEIKHNARNLLDQIDSQPSLKRIKDNPLMLRLSAEVYSPQGKFAQNRTELYELWIDHIWQRAVNRGIPENQKAEIFDQLECIAWSLHNKIEFSLNIDLQILRDKLGIVVLVDNQLAFSHLSVREFFVSKCLQKFWDKNKKLAWKFLKPRLHLPTWKEPLLLFSGSLENSTHLIKKVLNKKSTCENILKRDLALSLEMASESKSIDNRIIKKITQNALKIHIRYFLMFHEQYTIWGKLIARLGDKAIEPLLNVPDILIEGMVAARIIGMIGTEESQKALEQIVLSPSKSIDTKKMALQEIGRFQNEQAFTILNKSLENKDLCNAAMIGLAKFKDPKILDQIIKTMEGSKDRLIIEETVINSLVEIGGEESENTLINLLQQTNVDSPFPYNYIVQALGELGGKKSVEALKSEVHKYQSPSSKYLRAREAVDALGQIKSTKVADALWQFAIIYPSVKAEATLALKSIEEPSAVENLLQAYKNYHLLPQGPELERVIISSSNFSDVGELYDADLSAKEKVFYAIKKRAMDALCDIGDERIVQLILADLPGILEYHIIVALGNAGNPKALDILLPALDSKNYYIRREAATSLGKLKDGRAIERLVKALQENQSQPDIKSFLSWFLIPLTEGKGIPHYFQTEAYYQIRIRMEIIKSLGQIGNNIAINSLIDRFNYDPNIRVRIDASEAIGQLGDFKSLSTLIKPLRYLRYRSATGEPGIYLDRLRENIIISIGNLSNTINNRNFIKGIVNTLAYYHKAAGTQNITHATFVAINRLILRQEELIVGKKKAFNLCSEIQTQDTLSPSSLQRFIRPAIAFITAVLLVIILGVSSALSDTLNDLFVSIWGIELQTWVMNHPIETLILILLIAILSVAIDQLRNRKQS